MTNSESKTPSSRVGRNAAGLAVIAAVCFCVLFVIFRGVGAGSGTDSEEARNGAEYVASYSGREAQAIASKVNESARAQNAKKMTDLLSGLDDGTTDLWSLFGDMVILGDSRAEAFVGYEFLPETIVYAKKGGSMKTVLENIDAITAAQPAALILTYGVNDVNGNWHDAQQFIGMYRDAIKEYKERVPDAGIYVCSLIPVQSIAVEEDATFEDVPIYAAAIEEMCEEEGYIFIDCDSLADYDEYYEKDGIHFTKQIYPLWGELIIRKVLSNEG